MKRFFGLIIAFLIVTSAAYAQNFDVKMQAKNMHYWRGLKVTDAFMTGTSVGYFGKKVSVFAWGGMSLDGKYREVTNVVSYAHKNFSATLIDIYNFSGIQNGDLEYFNYKQSESGHIVDLTLGYKLKFMNIAFSTVLYGNDRISAENTDQRYSSFLQLEFPFKKKDVIITPYIAPAFALNPDAENQLYGNDKYGIADLGLKVSKKVSIKDYELPVTGQLGYNFMLNQASMQVSIDLF
jgi:hypothetical protein